MLLSEEAADVKDSAEKMKKALEEARRAQTAASSAIQQAAGDIQNTNNLLSTVSSDPTLCVNDLSTRAELQGFNVSKTVLEFNCQKKCYRRGCSSCLFLASPIPLKGEYETWCIDILND